MSLRRKCKRNKTENCDRCICPDCVNKKCKKENGFYLNDELCPVKTYCSGFIEWIKYIAGDKKDISFRESYAKDLKFPYRLYGR